MAEPVKQLVALLKDADVEVTFSMHCASGLIGDMCQCHRCRRGRGEPVTDETEAQAAREARLADRAFRNGFALGQHPDTAGIREQLFPTPEAPDGA